VTKVTSCRLLLLALLLALAAPAGALEKCVSAAGKVTYSEQPCPAGSKASTVRGTSTPAPATSTAKGGGAKKASVTTGLGGGREGGQVEIRYVDVQGGDYETLLAALKKPGMQGHAEWSLAYEYQPRRAGKACSVASLTTTLKQVMILPRWSPPRGVSPGLVAAWTRYLAGLRKHQEGHLAIGRGLQDAFRNSLAVTQRRCEKLDAEIKAQFELLLEKYRAREKAYDSETGNGRTEGAELVLR